MLEADAHGLKIAYLRRRLTEGTYATGVVGVWPTVIVVDYPAAVILKMPWALPLSKRRSKCLRPSLPVTRSREMNS